MTLKTSRREFFAATAALGVAPQVTAASKFERRDLPLAVKPFRLTQVRLADGPLLVAQESNRSVLHKLPVDRLAHNFRINAGLPSSAQPLGGWERPDCEVRGHFTGHYLSAAALMHASTGDAGLKTKASALVNELAQCQKALGAGYLSAFPLEYWDRLNARKPVWAPYYTLHKIMAGLLDVHEHCGNEQALEVLEGVAGWVDNWTAPIPEAHMQDILNTEFGGMAEVLYNLAGVTNNARYADTARRFEHARIFDPLAGRRDELKGLHANTNVPKIIGAARRYELTRDAQYRDIAEFFWYEVTSARTYCTGGTSNAEHWRTEPRHLAAELALSRETNECCVAYNMMKLTRHLYQWNPQPSYFDYYERALFNHRLGAIEPESGATMYFLPLRAGAWKIFNTEYDSFWCCTGTGVEEYSKANDSIYFHDDLGLYVNLFIASELNAPDRGIRLRQQTRFPEEYGTTLIVDAAPPRAMTIRIRIPGWLGPGGSAAVNGKPLDAFAGPGSYLAISRVWKAGDRIDVHLPMTFRLERMPDDETLAAVMYGPLVMAAGLGPVNANQFQKDQDLKTQPLFETPDLETARFERSGAEPLRFRAGDLTFAPLYQRMHERYAVYLRVRS
jgi:DUF1680 family protein